MKATLLSCLLGLVLAFPAAAEWKTDFEAAKAAATKSGKVMVLDFTGSDWCVWCVRMKKDTLDKPEFTQYAAKNLVLVELDFPNDKPQTSAQKKANKALKDKYGVRGFPTFLIVDAAGKELGRVEGYLEGGPKAFITAIEEAKKKAVKPVS